MTFKEKCDRAGLDLAGAVTTRHKHPELTDEQIIKFLKSTKPTFTGKCLEAGIVLGANLEKRDFDAIPLEERCLDLGVSYEDTLAFKDTRPDLTNNRILEYMVGVEL